MAVRLPDFGTTAGRQQIRDGGRRILSVGQDVTQRLVALPLLLVADAVFLAQTFDCDDAIAHFWTQK